VAQSIIKCVTSCKIDFENIQAFVSDNVAYMRKCFNDILKALFKNCRHVTCVAHILALVGECWRINLKELDSFINLVKQIFCKSPARRRRWIQHLKDHNVDKPRMPPSPVIVRLNTRFKAAIFYAEHFKYYSDFITNERLNEDDTQSLTALDNLFKNLLNCKIR
jgi:hypothetical protein